MKNDEEDVVCVTFKGLDATFTEIIPEFDGFVVAGGYEVRSICSRVEIHVVDTFIVSVHSEIRIRGSQRPHFDGPIQTRGSKGVGVFGIYGDIHDVVGVALVDLQELQ